MDDFDLTEDEIQEMLNRKKDAEDRANGLVVVNRDDIDSEMWNATWDVCFDADWHGAIIYRVAADCKSDALDEVIDWLEKNDPEALSRIVLDDVDFLNMSDHMQQSLEFAGNHGLPLHPEFEISVTLVKKHRYAHGYY